MFRSIFALFILTFASVTQASVILSTTRVIFNSADKEATVQIRNPDSVPKLIQSWIDIGDKNALPDLVDAPFQILPPVFRVNEGKGQALRILALPNELPQDRESVFWLNVLEVPPKPDSVEGENYVQFALRNRIKVFLRPSGLQGRASSAGEDLEWRMVGNSLVVKNPTPYHVSLNAAKVLQANAEKGTDLLVDMVSPFSEQPISIEGIAVAAGQKIEFSYIDDLGAVRKFSQTIQHQ